MSNLTKTRKVTILFTQSSTRETLDTAAETWGELQKAISGNVKDKNCVVRETKNTLQSTEARLPEGNFVIFAYPQESKAGAKKVAKKAKKVTKKVTKKAAKKSAPKKAAKKATKKGVVKKISKPAPAGTAPVKQAPVVEEDLNALLNEANDTKRTLPSRR